MPRVGLTTYLEAARFGVWDQRAALLPAAYAEVVARAGGVPVLLPPIVPPDLDAAAASVVAGLDGVVLTGGSDVDPERYGAPVHQETDRPQRSRDDWEEALLRAALAVDLPVLAVCRGLQVLNVVLGGTLHQHLPEVVGGSTHRPEVGTFGTVEVQVDPASRLGAIVGPTVAARCHHHQAVDHLGEGLVVCAIAPDGTIEGVEHRTAGFVVAVQWHPEEAGDERLFAGLIHAAAVRCAP